MRTVDDLLRGKIAGWATGSLDAFLNKRTS